MYARVKPFPYNLQHLRYQVVAALKSANLSHVHFTIRKEKSRGNCGFDVTVTFDECEDDAANAMHAASAAVTPWFEQNRYDFGCFRYYQYNGDRCQTREPYVSLGFYTGFG